MHRYGVALGPLGTARVKRITAPEKRTKRKMDSMVSYSYYVPRWQPRAVHSDIFDERYPVSPGLNLSRR